MDNEKLLALAARYGTPLYVFDADEFAARLRMVKTALGEKIRLCYSMKANPFLLACLPEELGALEVCSPGELTVCENAGVDLSHIIFSGVNKTLECVARAVEDNVEVFTVESYLHLDNIEAAAAAAGKQADVLMRLTSDNQFGMDEEELVKAVSERERWPHVNMVGLHYFSGTLKKRPTLVGRELARMEALAERLERECGLKIERLEYGPGLWIDYFGSDPDAAEQALLDEIAPLLRDVAERYELTVEMGRFYSASCGYYLTRVMDKKTNCGFHYAIVDGGLHQMNYDGQMKGTAVPPIANLSAPQGEAETWCLCGSLCTPNDVLVRAVEMAEPALGDVLVFGRTGAYSINEGFAFLLSRDLPAVVIYSEAEGAKMARGHIRLDPFNTPNIT